MDKAKVPNKRLGMSPGRSSEPLTLFEHSIGHRYVAKASPDWDFPGRAGTATRHDNPISWDELARELQSVKEDERRKIAEQLHDELAQELSLAKLKLGQLSEAFPRRHRVHIHEIIDIIKEAIHHTRTVIHELSPQDLYERGLTAALQSLVEEIQVKYGIRCTAILDPALNRLPEQVHQALLRAARELLLNTVKHAHASRAHVTLRSKQNSMILEVSDDGRGFAFHKTDSVNLTTGGFGLFSLRAQVAGLGGSLRIVSDVGKGTRATVTMPLGAN